MDKDRNTNYQEHGCKHTESISCSYSGFFSLCLLLPSCKKTSHMTNNTLTAPADIQYLRGPGRAAETP
jgi:hypothetical protein